MESAADRLSPVPSSEPGLDPALAAPPRLRSAGDPAMRAEVLAGLLAPRKRLPPKYFYDRRGSELFEEICAQPEYYPTRTELGILRRQAGELAELIGEGATLIEFGSGASVKTRLLLNQLRAPALYVPLDISWEFLRASALTLQAEYPALPIRPVCADFMEPVTLPPEVLGKPGRRVVFFPGSTLGNLDPVEQLAFLRGTARLLGPGGLLLLGVDLIKDRSLLEAAYNDAQGVTREFNLNLLSRLNRELGCDFELESFEHLAFLNEREERIEMHLVATRDQLVRLDEQVIRFRARETIHTESSYKFSRPRLEGMAYRAGFRPVRFWTDAMALFGVALFEAHPPVGRLSPGLGE